jgi:hypothetical protein
MLAGWAKAQDEWNLPAWAVDSKVGYQRLCRVESGVKEIPPLEVPVWALLVVPASGDGEAGRMEAPVVAMIRTCPVDWQWLQPGRCLWEAPRP